MGAEPESRFVSVRDGLRLHARDYGDPASSRLPAVCLPGLSRTAEDFERLARHLAADGRRVIALDHRGRGLSAWDPNPKNYDLQVESNDIADVLAALGVDRAAFIGTSRGGLHICIFIIPLHTLSFNLSLGGLEGAAPLTPKGLKDLSSFLTKLLKWPSFMSLSISSINWWHSLVLCPVDR